MLNEANPLTFLLTENKILSSIYGQYWLFLEYALEDPFGNSDS